MCAERLLLVTLKTTFDALHGEPCSGCRRPHVIPCKSPCCRMAVLSREANTGTWMRCQNDRGMGWTNRPFSLQRSHPSVTQIPSNGDSDLKWPSVMWCKNRVSPILINTSVVRCRRCQTPIAMMGTHLISRDVQAVFTSLGTIVLLSNSRTTPSIVTCLNGEREDVKKQG